MSLQFYFALNCAEKKNTQNRPTVISTILKCLIQALGTVTLLDKLITAHLLSSSQRKTMPIKLQLPISYYDA